MSTEDKKMQWALEPTTGTDTESGQVKQISVPEKGDVGLELLAQAGPVDYTEEEAQQVKRKIDMCLLPIVRSENEVIMFLANMCFSLPSHSASSILTRLLLVMPQYMVCVRILA